MNISGNAEEAISFENEINKMREVFSFLYMPLVASSSFGNVLIILVVARDKLTTTSILFGILAGEDLLVTYMGPLINITIWFSSTAKNYMNSVVVTQYREFLVQAIAALSTWTLVLITTERFLSITMPFNVKQMITVKRVILAEIAISIAVVAIQYLRVFLGYTVVNVQNMILLVPSSPSWELFNPVSDWICFTGVPFMVIIIASLVIWIKLRTSIGQSSAKSARFRSVTTNLLMANVSFLLTKIPHRLVNVIMTSYRDDDFVKYLATNVQFWAIVYGTRYLTFLNHALNFYVYILSGQKFREDVNRLFSSLKMCKK